MEGLLGGAVGGGWGKGQRLHTGQRWGHPQGRHPAPQQTRVLTVGGSHSLIRSFLPFLKHIKFLPPWGPRTLVLKVWPKGQQISVIGGVLDRHVRMGRPGRALSKQPVALTQGDLTPPLPASSASCRSQQSCPLLPKTVPSHLLRQALPRFLSIPPSPYVLILALLLLGMVLCVYLDISLPLASSNPLSRHLVCLARRGGSQDTC